MERSLVKHLPHPLASALQAVLDEDLPRSADELCDMVVALIEYVGAVALADYLDGNEDENQCAGDPMLNSWLIAQLASGKVGAGLWARWTQLAVQNTPQPALPFLRDHVDQSDLDDPNSDLSWLLRFRNDVMHGGFVAPLPQIHRARERLTRVIERLQPLWELRALGCTDAIKGVWWHLEGLQPTPADAPTIDRDRWTGDGAVLLTNGSGQAILALHPACTVVPSGELHLQHDWRQEHKAWFSRPGIRAFFERYTQERNGHIDDKTWRQQVAEALPANGRVARPWVEGPLREALLKPGAIVRLVGPEGSGRSTLALALSELTERTVKVLPVLPDSVRMDPGVVRRWTLQTLSHHYLDREAPPEAWAGGLKGKRKTIRDTWIAAMDSARRERSAPILVIDDAELVGSGIYAGLPTSGCLADASRFGASVLLSHRPSGTPPAGGDRQIDLLPWTAEELQSWGEPEAMLSISGGHPALLVDPAAGLETLRKRLINDTADQPLARPCLEALARSPQRLLPLADELDQFTPKVELTLRGLRDHLLPAAGPPDQGERYQLHPAVQLLFKAGAPWA